jgi:hypothetical protein
MRKLYRLLFSAYLFLLSGSAFAFTGIWSYGAVVSNPLSSTVFNSVTLPSSGSSASPPSANYVVGIDMYCSLAETYIFQVINSSSVVIASIPQPCCATCGAAANSKPATLTSFLIQDGWKIQIIPQAGFTGFGSAQIYYAIEGLN